MRFYNYLTESRTTDIKEDKALELIKKNYGQALKNALNFDAIWRGSGAKTNTGYATVDVNKMRKSANTFNYYTLIMNNDPAWSKFPKRKLICSTDKDTAESYATEGDAFLVLPPDNSKVGICPDSDIWTSFNIGALIAFKINKLINVTLIEMGLHSENIDEDFEKFKSACLEIDLDDEEMEKKFKNKPLNELDKKFLQSKYNNFYDFLINEVFPPDKPSSQFEIENIKNFKTSDIREVWIDQQPILIEAEKFYNNYDKLGELI